MGGILLSKMSASRIKSSKGKVSNLKCALMSKFLVSLAGALLLVLIHKLNVPEKYEEAIIFIV